MILPKHVQFNLPNSAFCFSFYLSLAVVWTSMFIWNVRDATLQCAKFSLCPDDVKHCHTFLKFMIFFFVKLLWIKKKLLSFGFLQINYDWIWCVSADAILIIPLSTYMVLFYRKEMKSLDFPVKVNRHFEHTIHCDFLHTCM
jgi:hypothetical protein